MRYTVTNISVDPVSLPYGVELAPAASTVVFIPSDITETIANSPAGVPTCGLDLEWQKLLGLATALFDMVSSGLITATLLT